MRGRRVSASARVVQHPVRLSIITVCRNEQEHIADTAESISGQTFREFEWIVVDGLSEDGTVRILSPYKAHIHTLLSERDNGVYHAMNKGARLARGEYLLFLNGGDMLAGDNVLQESFAVPGCADILIGDMIARRHDGTQRVMTCNDDMLKPQHLWTASFPHPSTFIRRELFVALNGYDESFRIAADYDLFARAVLANCASIGLLRRVVSIFRVGGLSTASKWRALRDAESQRIRRRYTPKWELLKRGVASWRHS